MSAPRPALPPLLLRALGDGAFHSGEVLATTLGLSRSAVWKGVRALRELGAEIHSVPNRGYRLAAGRPGGVALEAALIHAALPAQARLRIAALEVAWSMPSTNAALLERPPPPPGAALVQFAEHQSAGRGRRGRSWLAPLGGALCCSIGWTFAQLPREISALSLAAGVAVRRALAAQGVTGVGLKWPNDLLADDAKLGGILIELRAEAGGPGYVVIGLGLNVVLGAALRAAVAGTGTQAVDLAALGHGEADRNALAAAIVAELVAALVQFTAQGLAPFAAEWAAADALRGRPVLAQSAGGELRGIARGIDAAGALLIETPCGVERAVSGEVTVRAQA